jgi:hypothetical protein
VGEGEISESTVGLRAKPALSFQSRDHPPAARGGRVMGGRVLDRIIIGKGRYVSFDDGYW